MRLPRLLFAVVLACAALRAAATDVVIASEPTASLSPGKTFNVQATLRNRDTVPTAALKWRLTAAESVAGALAGQHRFIAEGPVPAIAPGGVQNVLASGSYGDYETLPSGTYQLVFMVMEQAGAPTEAGFVVREARSAGSATVLSGSPNYTGLWWEPGAPGWGLNLAQQGSIIFATLFTYSAQGQPMWLVASRIERRPDNTYRGKLYRATGPVFNASPWGAVNVVEVGEMGLRFQGTSGFGIVTYDVDGVMVSREIFRQVFASPVPTCTETLASAELANNYQALWWDPAEPGWGVTSRTRATSSSPRSSPTTREARRSGTWPPTCGASPTAASWESSIA